MHWGGWICQLLFPTKVLHIGGAFFSLHENSSVPQCKFCLICKFLYAIFFGKAISLNIAHFIFTKIFQCTLYVQLCTADKSIAKFSCVNFEGGLCFGSRTVSEFANQGSSLLNVVGIYFLPTPYSVQTLEQVCDITSFC